MKRTIATVAVTAFVVAAVAFAIGRASNPSDDAAVTTRASEADDHHESASGAAEPAIEGARHVHSVAHLPGGQLLLGAHSGLYRSGDGGRSWEKTDVVGDVEATDFMSLVPHPTAPGTLFAAGTGSAW